ncbi:MAG TPA: glycogen synthase GlgA, partial [Candidatus Acetothermia bacterium]|nr:glycogen synthase GlgA [Candidatus Acetothermia bacterium]
MRTVVVSAEVSPFAKAGGLADVASALPRALSKLGVDVRVIMPKYRGVVAKTSLEEVARFPVTVGKSDEDCIVYRGKLPAGEVPVFFLGNDHYFDRAQIYGEGGGDYPDALERFVFLSRGALRLQEELDWQVDIIHVNDWHTSLIPTYLKAGLGPRNSRSVLTIHNLAYQGVFPREQAGVTGLSDELLAPFKHAGKLNLLRGGILQADLLTTVSPSYAEEILISGEGLEGDLRSRRSDLSGILNGVDYTVWNPQTDRHLWANYSTEDMRGKGENKRQLLLELGLDAEGRAPLVGMISRLAEQKGFDLIMASFERMLSFGIRFVLLGAGSPQIEDFFRSAAKRYPEQVAALITFSEQWAHRIEAASDIFLMPSRFEPCGLNQMYSLRYGTVPVVRATGGLRDTVHEYDPHTVGGNGFTFTDYSAQEMLSAVRRAISLYREDPKEWSRLRDRGMREDHSWEASAGKYRDLYEEALATPA